MIPNVLAIGEPGSGKSVAAARDAVEFPGSVVVLDPHRDSLARLATFEYERAGFGHGGPILSGASGRVRATWGKT